MAKLKWQHQLLSSFVTSLHQLPSITELSVGSVEGIIDHKILLIGVVTPVLIFCVIGLHKTCLRPSIKVIVITLAIISSVFFKDETCRPNERERYNINGNDFYDGRANDIKLHSSRKIPIEGLRYINGKWLMSSDNRIVLSRDDKWVNSSDERIIRFRGVNLPAKTPSSPENLRNTRNSVKFYESKHNVSFLNRPFSLEEAPIHFRRLSQHWGFNLIRLSVTWEAVMHECPGCVDTAYLAYIKALVQLAEDSGLYVIIDPHQDVWSRFTGGDGAPWWTIDAVGFDTSTSALHDTGSAVLHQHWRGALPKMMWTTNYWKLTCATMFSLFFGGNIYAPGITALNTTIPIQDFLQGHYFDFIDIVAKTVKDCPNVLGFGTMNEPSNGFIGIENLAEVHSPTLHGHVLSGFDSMRLGSGESLNVSYFPSHFRNDSIATLNPECLLAFKSPDLDVWQRVGVYEIDAIGKRVLLRPNHFSLAPGETFETTYMHPFYKKVQQVIERNNRAFVTYTEPYFDTANVDMSPKAPLFDSNNGSAKIGFAPHWYDAITLFIGHYNSFLFSGLMERLFRKNLFKIKNDSHGVHVLIGETGVPFFGSESDYTMSLDRTLKVMEANDLDYVIWCYESDNRPAIGDLWNREDLSLYSNGRGRGLRAALRPFPYHYSSGLEVSSQSFDSSSGTYKLVLDDNGPCVVECIAKVFLFVPSFQYSRGITLTVSTGELRHDIESQNIEWTFARTKKQRYSFAISTAKRN